MGIYQQFQKIIYKDMPYFLYSEHDSLL